MNLNVAILSRRSFAYSTRRLVEACSARGHHVRVLDTARAGLLVDAGRRDLYYRSRSLPAFDAVIPRIGASLTRHGTALLRQFEQCGVFCLNTAQAVAAAGDKLWTLQLLSRHDVAIPPTAFVRDRSSVRAAIERVGGPPVVVKLVEGSQGRGVMLAETGALAESIAESLMLAHQDVVIQRFVRESRGEDLRVLVVGDRVVAAMRRRAADGEYRSNLHRGALAEPATLSDEMQYAALRAARILGLRVAGVDLLESHGGPLVLEVNSSPGLEGIESVTRVNVAGAIAAHLEEQVEFPDLDLRQRLGAAAGYGVAELVVEAGTALVGRSLAELSLAARHTHVLSLGRGGTELPNPRGDFVLEVGDKLLCFGRQETLRELLRPGPSSLRRGSDPGEHAA